MGKGKEYALGSETIEGMGLDHEGPDADYLIDTTEIFDRTVYEHVHVQNEEWTLIDEHEAAPYLPSKDTSRQRKVSIGIGENRKEILLSTFDSLVIDDYFEQQKGHIINTGGSIWGLDFVPKSPDTANNNDTNIHYLAVAGLRGTSDNEHFSCGVQQPVGTYKNAIQLWKMQLSTKLEPKKATLDMCLLHDFGIVCDLMWCPYGVYQDENAMIDGIPKLGILAFICGDGTVRTIVVPHPEAFRKQMCPEEYQQDTAKTIYLKINSARCTLGIQSVGATCIKWGGHKKLAVGHNNGLISIWNIEKLLEQPNGNDITKSKSSLIVSTACLDASVRRIAWDRYIDPTKLLIGGYDGQLLIFDLNDPSFPKALFRTRGVVTSIAWSNHSHLMFYADGDGMCHGDGIGNDLNHVGLKYGFVPGHVWDLCVSPHHGRLAAVSSLGWLRSSNMFVNRKKKFTIVQKTVYKLHYEEDTEELRYIDGIGFYNLDETRSSQAYNHFGKGLMALHKATWNPNKATSAFLATGGAAGLCRIDFEGKGSKWS